MMMTTTTTTTMRADYSKTPRICCGRMQRVPSWLECGAVELILFVLLDCCCCCCGSLQRLEYLQFSSCCCYCPSSCWLWIGVAETEEEVWSSSWKRTHADVEHGKFAVDDDDDHDNNSDDVRFLPLWTKPRAAEWIAGAEADRRNALSTWLSLVKRDESKNA